MIYWPFSGGLLKSTNSGASWTQVGADLMPVHPIELSNGRLVSVGATHLMLSADNGTSWSPAGPVLPFAPSGVIFSERRRAFFIWKGDCGKVVAPNSIMMAS
jgi:hypothetical protein